MKLRDLIDLGTLQSLQDQFSDATGLAAIAVDAQGEYITKGSNFTEFCMKYTRGCEEGMRRCVKCDTECSGTYFCHAGLMDFSSDIVVDGEKLGAVIGGQVLPAEPDEDRFRLIARELGVDEEGYLQALRKVPVRTEKSIRAAAGLLGSVVNQLVNAEHLKRLNQKKVVVFEAEVGNALASIREMKGKMRDLQQTATMTDLLAINASIEASHAGQAGVGFAIVAREMSSLSKQSASVYKEIEKLVGSVENSVEKMNRVEL